MGGPIPSNIGYLGEYFGVGEAAELGCARAARGGAEAAAFAQDLVDLSLVLIVKFDGRVGADLDADPAGDALVGVDDRDLAADVDGPLDQDGQGPGDGRLGLGDASTRGLG